MKKVIILLSVFVSLFLLWCTQTDDANKDLNITEIAKCMWEKWVKMYWTETCSYCLKQKEMFGEDFKYIWYVDCVKNLSLCGNISWTPTREFPWWEMLVGFQSISTLAEKAWCL